MITLSEEAKKKCDEQSADIGANASTSPRDKFDVAKLSYNAGYESGCEQRESEVSRDLMSRFLHEQRMANVERQLDYVDQKKRELEHYTMNLENEIKDLKSKLSVFEGMTFSENAEIARLKKELETVIKIGVEGQREINRKLTVKFNIAIKALTELSNYQVAKDALEHLNCGTHKT